MRISRLYVDSAITIGQDLELNTLEAHYLRTVLRLKINAPVVVFNGAGGEYSGYLSNVTRKEVTVYLQQWQPAITVESELQIHLGIGISRADRMDLVMQKAVELGVKSISPLITERGNLRLNATNASKKMQHWQKIAQQACEQSGRTIIPTIFPVQTLVNWLPQQSAVKICLDPYSQIKLSQLNITSATNITLLSGAEGGFTTAEVDLAKQHDFQTIQLGTRVLRTETAALAALAALQVLAGDF